MTIFPLMLIRTAGLPLHWLDELTIDWPAEEMPEAIVAQSIRQAFDAALMALDESPVRTAVYNARRDFFQKNKMPNTGFFLLMDKNRVGAEILQLVESLEFWKKYQLEQQEFYQQYERALQANFRALQQAARSDTLRRALLFASHDLMNRLSAFSEKRVEDFNKKDRQTALSLLQYLTRAAVKTSPLSKFTTVTVWDPAIQSNPLLDEKGIEEGRVEREGNHFLSSPQSRVVPNVALLPAIYEILLREPAFYEALPVVLNPCITDNQQRTWFHFDGENESFQQIEDNPVADFIAAILLQNERQLPFRQLLFRLQDEVEATPTQLQHLVLELIDLGMLEWDLPEKGLTSGWCSKLYNFLGFLPRQPPVIVDAAALLQWLRTAARTLPFQPIEEAQETQRETVVQASRFFERHGGTMPPIPPEQIFFEDVAERLGDFVPEESFRVLAKDLAECWQKRNIQKVPSFRAQIFSFAEKTIAVGEGIDFLVFCQQFLEWRTSSGAVTSSHQTAGPGSEKIGALLQIFRDETGCLRAVVNGLFPGGGKLFARWSHLFTQEVTEQLKAWHASVGQERVGVAFPWQGWSNSNFQPLISKNSLAVPEGRIDTLGGHQILLGNLAIWRVGERVELIDKESNKTVLLNDLGLEAPALRPPAMQILWHLGVPYVSLEAILPERHWVIDEGWQFTDRVEHGSLILARKTWQIGTARIAQWLSEKSVAVFFRRVKTDLSAMSVPRRFFAHPLREKPQYFDRDSPVSIQLFAKMLRQAKSPVVLTEMLPLPEQCVVKKDGLRAAEFVVEFEI